MSASIMARDDFDQTDEAMEMSLIPALQHHLQALDLPGARVHLRLPVTGELAQVPDLGRRREGGPHHPVRRHVRQSLRVGQVRLAARDVLL
jgi:hypothetical protein